ncbi:hypothetical protein [Blautia sp. MSJ-19]|uniref:hypothetical protein n=1 Tax=Blautia sp. MSJ-19 TaxID=2841517 RepID=UPI001C0EEAD8|nr:hypothetical protein [Blautia sp. MSJ-19]MBU5481518.1 hypothetical protein [Blautia sp. MSJ-19]
MRRKQLYAIILAGALAASGTPAAVFAAEGDVAATAETSEETPTEGDLSDGDAETPAEETPVTEAPAENTTSAEETPATETPAEDAGTEQTPAAETQTEDTTEDKSEETTTDPKESAEETGIYITEEATDTTEAKNHYFSSLQDAIDSQYAPAYNAETATKATVINVNDTYEISSTVNINGKKICIKAAAKGDSKAATITRNADFKGDMFAVTGENGELQFTSGEEASLTVSGKISDEEADTVDGSIVSVGTGAAFGMDSTVTLQDNNSAADGAAITSVGGKVVLKGGTITGNSGAKGAVYSDSDIYVQGTIVGKENESVTIGLTGTAAVVVTDVLTASNLTLTHESAADALTVVRAGSNEAGTALTADNFKAAVAQIAYATEDYTLTLAEDGLSVALKVNSSVTPTEAPTATPTPVPLKMSYKAKTLKWKDHNTVTLTMTVDGACKWYYFYVDAGTDTKTIQNMYIAKDATNAMDSSGEINITAAKVPEEDSWLVVCAKPNSGATAKMSVVKLNGSSFKKKRPAKVSATVTTRAPKEYTASQSEVSGLSGELKFFPGKFYEFSVKGAGMDNENPVQGDVRWVPVYWTTSKKSNAAQNTTWRIGVTKGMQNKEGKTYPIYIYLKKQVYNGTEWQDTEPQVLDYITTSDGKSLTFTPATISDEEWNAYIAELSGTPIPNSGNGGSGSGSGDGDATEAELTATAAASEKDAGSTSKSAVSTADESPIGTMSALAALSLLAGGYILVRKRKKEEL